MKEALPKLEGVSRSSYANYTGEYADKEGIFPRLKEIKAQYDPDNVFRSL